MRRDELHALATETRVLLSVLTKLARQDLEQHLQACGVPLGGLQYGVLRMLAHASCTIKDLSQQMALEPATLVPVVDALERNAWVKRGFDPNDRRRTPLSLTDAGLRLIESVPLVAPNSEFVEALADMGEDRALQFAELLRELTGRVMKDENFAPRLAESVRHQLKRQHTLLHARKSLLTHHKQMIKARKQLMKTAGQLRKPERRISK